MGTLTAGQPRLDHYCDHKLPTSCRLSSLGDCCACKDERAHTATYSTYIDGIGYVSRGSRWDRYCWYCKSYWHNRVEASGLRSTQTRIPEVPDQTEFLARWYEFHRGYRIVTKDDGTEERVAVLGEEFRDVDPGVLPRTLEELRAGRERSEAEERERLEGIRQQREREALEQATPAGPSIEDTIDQLFQSASLEDNDEPRDTVAASNEHALERPDVQRHVNGSNIHAQAMVPAATRNREYQARRIAALRRELHRMRSGIERVISGLRDLGEDVPDHTEASNRLIDLGRTLDNISGSSDPEAATRAMDSVNALTEGTAATQSDRAVANMQSRIDEARRQVDDARRNRDQAATELDLAEREFRTSQSQVRQLQNEQRTTENYMRLFGTREEMAAQGETYQSPIGGMFERAYERFQTAEEVRREERTLRQVLEAEARSGGDEEATARLADFEARERARDVWGVPESRTRGQGAGELQNPVTSQTGPRSTNGHTLRDAESDLDPRGEEVALEQYYGLLRRQGWSSDRNAVGPPARQPSEPSELPADVPVISNIVAGPPGQSLDALPHVNNDRGLDALFVLSALSASEPLRSRLSGNLTMSFIERLLRGVRENSLTATDQDNIESIMEDTDVIWGSGLPAERLRRRRQRGEQAGFHEMAHDMASAGSIVVHDVEIMAEAFQMSAHIRRRSGLHLSEQVRMLVRLQRGERASEDRAVLFRMLQNESTFSRAKHVHEEQFERPARNRGVHELAADLDRERQQVAREGDHSRLELDAQRRATQALAMAAGRVAMQATPSELLERLADRDEATRAAYERLQENGFTPATMSTRQFRTTYRPLNLEDFAAVPSETDSEHESDEDAKGLDAKDTGRPEEPLSEEDLTVKLDCQICYTQMADVACLPCGHLVMCKWCSDQHSPTMAHDKTRPRRAAACPVCRKQIRQKVRVFRP
ncbi:Putative Zinc finger, RING-type [Septoria linicola]|uniref:Zinc finger, RING-type n=1 Tax=Septoria linicola TaxID=215465 RepID=A0A9Q9ATA9_9PEZI|nr:putative Zinc finger, RING-type [Septoria linicola]USW52793.1 Putative Zinc finger, RING-type [Septoria linicola]